MLKNALLLWKKFIIIKIAERWGLRLQPFIFSLFYRNIQNAQKETAKDNSVT